MSLNRVGPKGVFVNSAERDVQIGVIGGSGLYDMDGLSDRETIQVDTPFGEPSGPIIVGTLGGQRVASSSDSPAKDSSKAGAHLHCGRNPRGRSYHGFSSYL